MPAEKKKGHIIDVDALPEDYPTQHMGVEFWEALGRAVATFGFLEEVLGKAIFAFTVEQIHNSEELRGAYERWILTFERALSDQLGNLIISFENAVVKFDYDKVGFPILIRELREASKLRNVLCHGSWRKPNQLGASLPFFVNKKMQIFQTAIDVEFLTKTRRATADLIYAVINTVTESGWQFPGSDGPGETIESKLGSRSKPFAD